MPAPSCPMPERAFLILQQIAAAPTALTVRGLAATLDMPLSSTYRHIAVLMRWGLVVELGQTGRYTAGPLCLQLSMQFQDRNALVLQARPEMVRLAESSGETVALMVATHYQAICIDMIESRQTLRCAFAPGKGQPLSKGATAMTLLAFMPESQRQVALEAYPHPDGEAALLEQVRQQGYAESDSMLDPGVWGVCAPLLAGAGRLAGALTLMAPSGRGHQDRDRLISLTLWAANRISAALTVD